MRSSPHGVGLSARLMNWHAGPDKSWSRWNRDISVQPSRPSARPSPQDASKARSAHKTMRFRAVNRAL